jgi:hypothetical protein
MRLIAINVFICKFLLHERLKTTGRRVKAAGGTGSIGHIYGDLTRMADRRESAAHALLRRGADDDRSDLITGVVEFGYRKLVLDNFSGIGGPPRLPADIGSRLLAHDAEVSAGGAAQFLRALRVAPGAGFGALQQLVRHAMGRRHGGRLRQGSGNFNKNAEHGGRVHQTSKSG